MLKKSQNLRSAQRLTHNDFTLAVDSVNLKNALGGIKADRSNFHHGWLPSLVVDNFHTVALRCREWEPSTPSALWPFADMRGIGPDSRV